MSGALLAMLVTFLSWIRAFDTLMLIVNYQEGDVLQNFPTLFALLLGSIAIRLRNVPLGYVLGEYKAFTKVLHN